MRWTSGVCMGLFLVLVSPPALRAEPPEPAAGSSDEVVGRVGERVITRRDVLSRLGLTLAEEEEGSTDRFREALAEQAWLLTTVFLAEEDRLAILSDLIASTASSQLAVHARTLTERSGKPCTEQDVLTRMGWTREAWEEATRCMLLGQTLLLYQRGGVHALQDGWEPDVTPADIDGYFKAERGRYQVQPAVRFVVLEVRLEDHLKEGVTRKEAAIQRSRTTERLAAALRLGEPPAEAAQRLGLPADCVGAPGPGQFVKADAILERAGPTVRDWLFDPARRRGDVEVLSTDEDDTLLLFFERRPGREVTFEAVRVRVEEDLHDARARHGVATLVLELAREPGFITPPHLALAVEARAVEVLAELAPHTTPQTSRAPPLPAGVFDSFEAALGEAAACDCLLYLHVDPEPDDAKRAVSGATLERLAKRHVVAVVSGRVGDRAADRLRLRYGLMRPGAMSIAIAPSGRLVDDAVPFGAEGAWKVMLAAERAAANAPPDASARRCSPAEDAPAVELWFEADLARVGEPLGLLARATNTITDPLEQLRATILYQGPAGAPRLVVLRMGEPGLPPGYDEEVRHEMRATAPGWTHALVLVEGGAAFRWGARARVYVR